MKTIYALIFWMVMISFPVKAQLTDSVLQVVYLLGNTATADLPAVHLNSFQQEIASQKYPFTVVHLGDLVNNNGFEKENQAATHKLDKLLAMFPAAGKGRLYLIPGDKDWDNSGPEGLKKVRNLETYINKNKACLLLPGKGCPGPEILDIGSGLRIIALNSPWFTHPYQKPEEPDTDCKILSSREFSEALEEAVSEAGNRNVLLVGHHPLYSNGVYGGRMPLKKHLFPLTDGQPDKYIPLPGLGTLYAAYRQNVGTPRDLANFRYQDYVTAMQRVLKSNRNLIYASGHEYSLQLNQVEGNYHLISGSFAQTDYVGRDKNSLFNKAEPGFTKLTYYTNGQVSGTFYTFKNNEANAAADILLFQSPCNAVSGKDNILNERYGPCVGKEEPSRENQAGSETGNRNTLVVAGEEYKARGFKKLLFGELYRPTWTQPVAIPYLYVSQTPTRLRPYKVGGGRQTTSIRFRGNDSLEFVFRSVNKDPEGALPPELRNTVVKDFLQDIMATEHPYGAMAVSKLLDATDILHAKPKLYVLGRDPALGPFQDKFAGFFGMLEERPLDPIHNQPGFGGSKDIKNTFAFFRELYKDHDNQIDAQAYAKARAFDLLVGDWGRHPDNWRWAAFQEGKTTVFRPIPRDRDHAFSHWNGLLPWLADRQWAVPNIQDFNQQMNGITSLTWTARHLDRALLTSLNRQQWQEIAGYLQKNITNEVIDLAIAELPREVRSGQGEEIRQKLKIRRQKLPRAVDQFYELLARRVDVVGSNKNEYFKVQRLADAKVRVQVFQKEKETQGPGGQAIFDRIFIKSETKEIRLYGLDGKDVFDISGQVPASIRLRIIGGTGKDSIRDVSDVSSLLRHTLIYDNTNTSLVLGKAGKNLTSDAPQINQYNHEAFEYNSYNPSGGLIYNKSDGWGISAGVNYQRQRFRKPDYGSLYSFRLRGTQNGNLQLTSHLLWRQVLGKLDFGADLDLGQYFRYYNFFGLGNNSVKNDDLYDANYFQARYGGLMSQVFVQRQFFRRSFLKAGPVFELFGTDFSSGTFLGEGGEPRVNVAGQQLTGGSIEFSLDLRDKPIFTQKGIRFYGKHDSYQRLKNGNDWFGLTQGFVDYYASARLLLPITLALRVGGARNYGRNLPFFKYAALGMNQNLRGYVINRFSGDASAYFNTELRFHIGRLNNSFLPFRYGLLTFYDQGKIWYQGNDTGGWHRGYGGGLYLAPVAERFTFSFLVQQSKEENLLFQVGAGFRFDN